MERKLIALNGEQSKNVGLLLWQKEEILNKINSLLLLCAKLIRCQQIKEYKNDIKI